MNQIIRILLLLLCLSAPALASDDPPSLKSQFLQAYKSYQAATEQNDRREMLIAADKAYEFGTSLYPKGSPTLAVLGQNLGEAMLSNRLYDEALRQMNATEKLFRQAYKKDAVELIDVYMTRAQVHLRLHDYDAARSDFNRSLKLVSKIDGPDGQLTEASLQTEIGSSLLGTVDAGRSGKYLKDALETYETLLGDSHETTAVARFWYGRYYMAVNNDRKAIQNFEAATAILDAKSPGNEAALISHAFLVNLHEKRGNSEKATEHCHAIGKSSPASGQRNRMPLFVEQPEYPAFLLRSEKEGYVVVELNVDENGFVFDPVIKEVNGDKAFGDAALAAVQSFRYAPAYVDGRAVQSSGLSYKFDFVLSD
jgi:TonB family protein